MLSHVSRINHQCPAQHLAIASCRSFTASQHRAGPCELELPSVMQVVSLANSADSMAVGGVSQGLFISGHELFTSAMSFCRLPHSCVCNEKKVVFMQPNVSSGLCIQMLCRSAPKCCRSHMQIRETKTRACSQWSFRFCCNWGLLYCSASATRSHCV